MREKDKVDVRRKHLKGRPRLEIDDSIKDIQVALNQLIKHYGHPLDIWEKVRNDYLKLQGKQQVWDMAGTIQKRNIITNVKNFLREAEHLATEYNGLSSTIYTLNTLGVITSVLRADEENYRKEP